MSLVFNAANTDYKGIVQVYEREIGANRGDVSGDSDRLKEFTADVNLAMDDFVEMAIKSSGTFQFDDTNQTDYPIMTTNIVSGQRGYSFTSDENGNLVLDIFRVVVADSSGTFHDLDPIDVESATDASGFWDGRNTAGSPSGYDKTGNTIFLNPIPNYNYANGLKVYINREASYFTSEDTTRKPGVPGIFHKYFALRPAQDYARRNSLANQNKIQEEVLRMEQDIKDYFTLRPKDERPRFTTAYENNQ